ncbi:hypothetical protein HYV44_01210 [Candidatus Microgenomates bacterium]|nr:hypothetical protein [Candidatus Microgenomates bacterium]
MIYENIIRIIGILLQIAVIIIAWKALSVWKTEIRGRDKYSFSKSLLEYIKNIRFLIYTNNGSIYQIFLNDILVDKRRFYEKDLVSIAKEKVYFDINYFLLFDHIDIRSDILLPKEIRLALEGLWPSSAKLVDKDKSKYTYLHLDVDSDSYDRIKNLDDGVNEVDSNKNTTIEEYFRKWEVLIMELQKSIYE